MSKAKSRVKSKAMSKTMSNAKPKKNTKHDCPFCKRAHNVERHFELAEMPVKSEKVMCLVEYFSCPITKNEDGNSWTPAKVLDKNLLRARDAYRIKHGLLTSDDIRAIRKKYGLTQKQLSNLLGIGNITVSRYETTHIQNELYDTALREVMTNPSFALNELKKHKDSFSEKKFSEVQSTLKMMIKSEGIAELKRQEIQRRYIDCDVESDSNGFKLLDIDKIADVISYFANHADNLYKAKLMILLWYSDVLFFNKYGKSMTGLIYQRIQLGALPLGHSEIIFLPTVNVIEKETEYGTSYHILPLKSASNPMFSLEEEEVLNKVASKFKDFSVKDISDYIHKEEAYSNTSEGEIILYSKATNAIQF